jgi:hypothetical protein
MSDLILTEGDLTIRAGDLALENEEQSVYSSLARRLKTPTKVYKLVLVEINKSFKLLDEDYGCNLVYYTSSPLSEVKPIINNEIERAFSQEKLIEIVSLSYPQTNYYTVEVDITYRYKQSVNTISI